MTRKALNLFRNHGRFTSELRIDLPPAEVIQRYADGETEQSLAIFFNVSRSVIRRRLLDAGVHIRGNSEARLLCWKNMNPEQRRKQIESAHNAVRGTKVGLEKKLKHAQTIEKYPTNFSDTEIQFQKMLSQRGIETIHQKAIGPYNVDLAAFPIAMEITGGNWHFYGNARIRFIKRIKYILDASWFILIFPINKSSPLTSLMADYATSYINFIRREKPFIREYRMIGSAGEVMAKGSLKDNNLTFIWPFHTCRDAATGQYKRIP